MLLVRLFISTIFNYAIAIFVVSVSIKCQNILLLEKIMTKINKNYFFDQNKIIYILLNNLKQFF